MRIETAKTLGLYMRDRRNALKLSQAELARRIGVSRHWIIEVERGKPRAELGLVLKALDALGLIVDVRGPSAPSAAPTDAAGNNSLLVDHVLHRALGAEARPPLTLKEPASSGSRPAAKAAARKPRKVGGERGSAG